MRRIVDRDIDRPIGRGQRLQYGIAGLIDINVAQRGRGRADGAGLHVAGPVVGDGGRADRSLRRADGVGRGEIHRAGIDLCSGISIVEDVSAGADAHRALLAGDDLSDQEVTGRGDRDDGREAIARDQRHLARARVDGVQGNIAARHRDHHFAIDVDRGVVLAERAARRATQGVQDDARRADGTAGRGRGDITVGRIERKGRARPRCRDIVEQQLAVVVLLGDRDVALGLHGIERERAVVIGDVDRTARTRLDRGLAPGILGARHQIDVGADAGRICGDGVPGVGGHGQRGRADAGGGVQRDVAPGRDAIQHGQVLRRGGTVDGSGRRGDVDSARGVDRSERDITLICRQRDDAAAAVRKQTR